MTQTYRTDRLVRAITGAVMLGLIGAAAQQTAAQSPLKPTTLPAPLAASHSLETAAVLRNDGTVIRSIYTADAMIRGINVRDLTPRDSIEQFFLTHYKSYKYSAFAYEPQEFFAMGDYAYESGIVRMTRRTAADTADRKASFRYVLVWKKMPDGAWLIHCSMNTNVIVPAPPKPPMEPLLLIHSPK